MPAVVVLPQPLRGGYTYQGIKPAVIVFRVDDLENHSLFEVKESKIKGEEAKQAVLDEIDRKQKESEAAAKRKTALKEGAGAPSCEEQAPTDPEEKKEELVDDDE